MPPHLEYSSSLKPQRPFGKRPDAVERYLRRQLVPDRLLRSTLPGASVAEETQSVPADRCLLSNSRRAGGIATQTQRAACSHHCTWKILTYPPGVASCLSVEKELLSRLSLAALRLRIGRTYSVRLVPGGRRAKDVGSAIVAEPCVGVPNEDVEQVVDSSDASRDRERESRSSFARRPSISMQQHRERARKARHRKSRRKDE